MPGHDKAERDNDRQLTCCLQEKRSPLSLVDSDLVLQHCQVSAELSHHLVVRLLVIAPAVTGNDVRPLIVVDVDGGSQTVT